MINLGIGLSFKYHNLFWNKKSQQQKIIVLPRLCLPIVAKLVNRERYLLALCIRPLV